MCRFVADPWGLCEFGQFEIKDCRTFNPLMETAGNDIPVGFTLLDQFIDNRCRCMRSLLASGASVDQTNHNEWTALMVAIWNFRLSEIH